MNEEITIANIQIKGSPQNLEKMLKMIEEIEAIEGVEVKLTVETKKAQTEKCSTCGKSCVFCLKQILDPNEGHPRYHQCWSGHIWATVKGVYSDYRFDEKGEMKLKE